MITILDQDIDPAKEAVKNALTKTVSKALKQYSKSTATTNAGRILRFIANILPLETIIEIAAHKVAPQK